MIQSDADIETEPPSVVCHDCDLLQQVPELAFGQSAWCSRCGALLLTRKKHTVTRTLALVISGLLLFVPAAASPMITLKALGEIRANNLFTGVRELFTTGFPDIATVVFLFSIFIPLIKLLALLYVLLPLKLRNVAPGSAFIFRTYLAMDSWGMLEVYLLGIFVSLTKLGSIATVIIGPGFYTFITLLSITAFASATLDAHEIWNRMEAAQ